ncbi:MAG: phosphotransferase family protein [Sphingobium sp.]
MSGARLASAPPGLADDIPILEDYLSRALQSSVAIRKISQSYPGISRETWIVRASANGQPADLIVRVDPPEGGGAGTSMQFEWQIFSRLHGSGVPVPEPLWFDETPALTGGRPLMVRRFVEGSSSVEGLHLPGEDGRERRWATTRECVEKLALVHQLDWEARGFADIMPAPSRPGDCWQSEIRIWRDIWQRRQPMPDPIIDEALCWLAEHAPDDTPCISLVKGNNGLGEEIWNDTRIVAMSDWEMASLGDGIADLFWSQGTLRLAPFDDIIRHYESCMEQRISPERLVFAAAFATAKQFIATVCNFYGPYFEGRTRRIYSLGGLTYAAGFRHRLGQCIGQPLLDVWPLFQNDEKSLYTRLGSAR